MTARGRDAEDTALAHLQRAGLTLEARNYRCRRGEIDLIMRDGDTLVFVEVRQRRSDRFGSGAESVDPHKQQRLLLTAEHYRQSHRGAARCPVRVDVVTMRHPDGTGLEWFRDAVTAD